MMKNIKILATLIICFIFQVGNGLAQTNSPQLLSIKGHNTQFAKDGKTVVYNSATKEIRSFDTEDTADKLIAEKAGLFVIEGQQVIIKDSKQDFSVNLNSGVQSKANSESKGISAWQSSDLRSIVIMKNGIKNVIQPKGDLDYINVSLSPDHSKIIFRATGMGSFVSDLEGNILKEVKNAEFPSWANDDQIVYAMVKDDGYQYEASEVFIENIKDNTKTKLTQNTDLIPLYPSVNFSGTKLIFSTPENDVYLMNL